MKIEQQYWTADEGWRVVRVNPELRRPDETSFVLVFGATDVLRVEALREQVHSFYPGAIIVGCSTAGEICDTRVRDDSIVITAVKMEYGSVKLAQCSLAAVGASLEAGKNLAESLSHDGLVHVLVLSDGLQVNGTELARGMRENLPAYVAVTGGLAGDGAGFKHTLVCADGVCVDGAVVALGFYGDRLKVGYGSLGGWDVFGAERLITHSKGNVLYELDGRSALTLYKEYLGEHVKGLPATALLFPLALRNEMGGYGLVRTVLGVSEEEQSMTFAGDMPEGSYAQLMKANFDRLVDGAAGAAATGNAMLHSVMPEFALLISCVGRKLVLKQRIEEEVDAVRQVMGPGAVLSGFYSYGEICPHGAITRCELHNQTMTITTFSER